VGTLPIEPGFRVKSRRDLEALFLLFLRAGGLLFRVGGEIVAPFSNNAALAVWVAPHADPLPVQEHVAVEGEHIALVRGVGQEGLEDGMGGVGVYFRAYEPQAYADAVKMRVHGQYGTVAGK